MTCLSSSVRILILFLMFFCLPVSALCGAVNFGPTAVYGTNAWSNVRLPPNNFLAGGIGPILLSNTDPNKIFIGAVNGGVWSSADGGQSWAPLTDSLSSLSIGALSFDAYNANNIYAGIGLFSNYASEGGRKTGLMGSTDGGTTWSSLGGRTLLDTNITSVTAAGNSILVGSVQNTGSNPGLYRSVDGGKTFQNILGMGGLPSGNLSVTSLASDPSNPSRVYAVLNGKGVYRSDNNGWTWTNVSSGMNFSSGDKNAKIAVGAKGASLFVGIVGSDGKLAEVWTSTNYGANWKSMGSSNTLPGSTESGTYFGITPGGQGYPNFSLVADPNNPNIVYIGGDRQPAGNEPGGTFPNSQGATSYTANLFRGNAAQALGGQWTSITNTNANSTAPHADGRSIAVDAAGNVIESDDGGINKLSNAGQSGQTWSSMNGNLSVAELHSIAFDSVSKRLFAGAQDVGTLRQNAQGSSLFSDISGGDGGKVAAVRIQSGPSAGNSIQYSSNGNLASFTRTQFNSSGAVVSTTDTALKVGALDLSAYETALASGNSYIVIAPYRGGALAGLSQGLAFGSGTVYWAQDSNPTAATLSLTNIGPGGFFNSYFSGLSFTEVSGKAAILGGVSSDLYYSADVMTANISKVAGYDKGSISDVLLTGSTSTGFTPGEFFVVGYNSASSNAVYTSSDTGANWTKRISRYGLFTLKDVGAQGGFMAAGGYGEVWAARDASLDDWYLISRGLPTVPVTQITSDDTGGVIYMSTLGRGIWSIALDASTVPVTPASTLEYGHMRLLRASTGNQTLDGGILQVPEDVSSPINITLNPGGGTLDSWVQAATLSGIISGPGALSKTGAGILSLSGVNSYSGGTAFNGGTTVISGDVNLGAASGPLSFNGGNLQLAGNWTSFRPITFYSGWGQIDTAGYTSTLNGVLSGVGGFYKLGSGTLYLTATNTYQGGTYISGGTLSISRDANLGASGSTLALDGGTLQTTAGITSSRIFYISPNGGTFDTQGNTSTLSGLFYGNGPYTQTGGGMISLTGDASYYTGNATIASGRFNLGYINFGGSLFISSGAWLTGNGTVASLTNAGTVSPGNSIGLIAVTGNYVQTAGSTLISEVSSSGASDQLVVQGTATLDGRLVVAPMSGGYYRTGLSSYTFLSAAGGVFGHFSSINLSPPYSPVLGFAVAVQDGSLTLAVSRAPYASYASNSRQVGAGNGLNIAAWNASGDMAGILSQLDFGTGTGINQALSQLHPEPYDAFKQTTFTVKRQYMSTLSGHLHDRGGSGDAASAFRGAFDGGSPVLTAASGGLGEAGPIAVRPGKFDAQRFGVFLEPFGISESQQNLSNRTGYRAGTGGLMGGFDYRLTDEFLMGAFGGYAQSGLKLRDIRSSQGSINNYSTGIFASYIKRAWFADAAMTLGLNSFNVNRGIAFPGTLRTAKARFDGLDYSFSASGGYKFNWEGFNFGPLASVDYVGLSQPGFSESRAGAIGLKLGPKDSSSLKSGLGVRCGYAFELDKARLTLTPEVSAVWEHEFVNQSQSMRAGFVGAPGADFSTPSAGPSRDSLRIKAGIAGQTLARGLGFYLRYESELGRIGNDVQSVSGGLKMSF